MFVHGNPLKETEIEENSTGLGKKFLDKFDQIFYGLLDEAAQYVTNDKQGAFKDMLIRHRADLIENVKKNLVSKDQITLDDVKNTFGREISNRLELFKYVGSGLWGKLNSWSRNVYQGYKSHCDQNSDKFWCLSSNEIGTARDGLERENI